MTLLTRRAEVFSVPTRKYISHELTVWLPYFLKRHILRKKVPKPPMIIEKEGKVEQITEDTMAVKGL